MSLHPPQDLGGNVLALAGNATTTVAADATNVLSTVVDRKAQSMPLSAIAVFSCGFTSASGAGGGKNTLLLEIEHSAVVGMTSPTSYRTLSYDFDWVANGLNVGQFIQEIDMSGFGQFVRIKAKLTESGTITISLQQIMLALILAGTQETPNPNRSITLGGYQTTVEPT